jgi:hypothetical protein
MLRSSDAQVRSYARRLFLMESILKSATSRTSPSVDHPTIVSRNEVRSKYAELLTSQKRFVSSGPTIYYFWVTVDFWGWQVSLESPSIEVRPSRLVMLLHLLHFTRHLYLGPLSIRPTFRADVERFGRMVSGESIDFEDTRSRSSVLRSIYNGFVGN